MHMYISWSQGQRQVRFERQVVILERVATWSKNEGSIIDGGKRSTRIP